MSFEALRKIQLQERSYAALTRVDDDFYAAYRSHIDATADGLRKDFTLEGASAYENIRKLLGEVVRHRERKIMLKAIHDHREGDVGSEGLAVEERELYNNLVNLLASHEAAVFGGASKTRAASAPKPVAVNSNDVQVQLLADVPQFVGVTGVVGPYGAQQLVRLAGEDAELLVSQGVAKRV